MSDLWYTNSQNSQNQAITSTESAGDEISTFFVPA